MTWPVRFAAALLCASSVLLLAPAAAHAALPAAVCSDAPDPQAPDAAFGHDFDYPDFPAHERGDSRYEERGWAGLSWDVADGCLTGPGDAPYVVTNLLANVMLQAATVGAAFVVGLHREVHDPALFDFLRPAQETVVAAVGGPVFAAFLPLAGLWVAWRVQARAGRADHAAVVSSLAWVVGVVAAAVAMVAQPLLLSSIADQGIVWANTITARALHGSSDDEADPVTAVGVLLHDSVLYPAWAAGAVGRGTGVPDDVVADLFDAKTLTWTEATAANRGDVEDAKRGEYDTLAAQVEDASEAARSTLDGREPLVRLAYGSVAVVSMLLVGAYAVVADLFVLLARLVWLFLPAALILTALAALDWRNRGRLLSVVSWAAGVAWGGVKLWLGVGVYLVVLGYVLDAGSGVAWWLQLVMVALLALVLWVFTRPDRHARVVTGLAKKVTGKAVDYTLARHALERELDEDRVKTAAMVAEPAAAPREPEPYSRWAGSAPAAERLGPDPTPPRPSGTVPVGDVEAGRRPVAALTAGGGGPREMTYDTATGTWRMPTDDLDERPVSRPAGSDAPIAGSPVSTTPGPPLALPAPPDPGIYQRDTPPALDAAPSRPAVYDDGQGQVEVYQRGEGRP